MEKKTPESKLFEEVQSVDNNALLPIPDDKQKPTWGSEDWSEYVVSLLTDKEVVDNKGQKLPKTDGLRRIANKILGRVRLSKSYVRECPNEANHFTAVVEHTLSFEDPDGNYLEVTGVADASSEHLQPPFNKYVTANASTKAMGRAYRDILQLQVCVAEELNQISDMVVVTDHEDAGLADDAQKTAIQSLCRRLKIDVNKFINYGVNKHKNINEVLKGTAKRMISVLNGYQSGEVQQIPDEIKL